MLEKLHKQKSKKTTNYSHENIYTYNLLFQLAE